VKVALPNAVQLRLGASKTITPPDIGLTRNYYNVALDTNGHRRHQQRGQRQRHGRQSVPEADPVH
jgi:hypothetical protein